MARTFIYARVSTIDQAIDNQLQEIQTAGFAADRGRIVTESISGSVAISECPSSPGERQSQQRVLCRPVTGLASIESARSCRGRLE